jgi:hypothetical protein
MRRPRNSKRLRRKVREKLKRLRKVFLKQKSLLQPNPRSRL